MLKVHLFYIVSLSDFKIWILHTTSPTHSFKKFFQFSSRISNKNSRMSQPKLSSSIKIILRFLGLNCISFLIKFLTKLSNKNSHNPVQKSNKSCKIFKKFKIV